MDAGTVIGTIILLALFVLVVGTLVGWGNSSMDIQAWLVVLGTTFLLVVLVGIILGGE